MVVNPSTSHPVGQECQDEIVKNCQCGASLFNVIFYSGNLCQWPHYCIANVGPYNVWSTFVSGHFETVSCKSLLHYTC